MKNVLLLIALMATFQISAQTDYSKVQKLVDDLARYGADISNFKTLQTSRSGVELTHKLDSVVGKTAFDFTINKSEMIYNASGNTTKMFQYGIDSVSGALRLEGVFTFSYAGLDLPSQMIIEGLNEETQELEVQIQADIIYDGAERVDSMVLSLPDPFTGLFGPLLATKQVYNGGLLVQTRQWLNIVLFGGWLPSSFTDFQYDGEDRLINEITTALDFEIFEMVPSSQSTYSYNAQGLQDTIKDFFWMDPVWEPTNRTMYTYHGNETLSSEITQLFSEGDFVNEYWTSFPVEDVDDQFPFTLYAWRADKDAWFKSDSTINLLNPALQWEQVAAPTQLSVLAAADLVVSFFATGSTIDETQYFLADPLTQEFFSDGKEIYYYSLIEGSAVNPVLPDYVTVNPNPAQDVFQITNDANQKADYKVYASTGMLRAQGTLNTGKNNISSSSWLPGMYYITITLADGSSFVHKQIIE